MISTIILLVKDPATTEIYTYCHTLSLHGALPISESDAQLLAQLANRVRAIARWHMVIQEPSLRRLIDQRDVQSFLGRPLPEMCDASKIFSHCVRMIKVRSKLGAILLLHGRNDTVRQPVSPGRAECRERVCQSVKIQEDEGT